MVIGACQSFPIFRQNNWLFKNNSHSVHTPLPFVQGERGRVEPPSKFSKREA